MRLYHFTSLIHLVHIEREGIARGEIPITRDDLENGVWFTNQKSPFGTGVSIGSSRTSSGGYFADKSSVCITVEISDDDPLLKRWPIYAKERCVSTSWYRTLDNAAGGGSMNFYLYLGTVPLEWIVEVEKFRFPNPEEVPYIRKAQAGTLEYRTASNDEKILN